MNTSTIDSTSNDGTMNTFTIHSTSNNRATPTTVVILRKWEAQIKVTNLY